MTLEIVTPVFVNRAEQYESHNWPMDRRLTLFRLGKKWARVAWDDKLGSGRFPCLVDLMIELLGSITQGTCCVDYSLFRITASSSWM